MALPVYNPAKHNVGLGGYGFSVQTYTKRSQEQPIEKVRVGTGDLVGNERLSYWTQEDYSGGAYQYEWSDPAMFSVCDGLVPNPLSRTLRTTPDIVKHLNVLDLSNQLSLHYNNVPLAGFAYGDACFFCFANGVLKIGANGSANFHYVPDGGLLSFWLDRETSRLYCGRVDGWTYVLSTGSMTVAVEIPPIIKGGTVIRGGITAMGMFGDRLMASFGRTLYLLSQDETLAEDSGDSNGTVIWAAGSVWVRTGSADDPSAGVLPARPTQMVPFNGQMYVLCGNASNEGFIASTTGQDVVTVCEIPYAVNPRCITQYAGRLYVGCGGYDLDSVEHFGELYELTGNSLRLVRTFKREKQTGRQRVQTIRWMDVQEGLLWFPGSTGYHLETYDAAADAFFTATGLPDFAREPLTKVVMVLGFRNVLMVWVDSPNDNLRGVWRTRQVAADYPAGPEYSSIHTSDFGPEPGRFKIWSELAVETRYAGAGGALASIDGGKTFAPLTPLGTEVNGDLFLTRFSLADVPPSRRVRLAITIAQPGFSGDAELVSHTLAFLFGDSGKHGWQVTLRCVHNPEGEDRLGEANSGVGPAEQFAQLWGWADTRQPVPFIDRNGFTHNVILTQCVESEPVLNDKIQREGFFSTYLVEV